MNLGNPWAKWSVPGGMLGEREKMKRSIRQFNSKNYRPVHRLSPCVDASADVPERIQVWGDGRGQEFQNWKFGRDPLERYASADADGAFVGRRTRVRNASRPAGRPGGRSRRADRSSEASRNDVPVVDVVILQADHGGIANTVEQLDVEDLLHAMLEFEECDDGTRAELNDPHAAFAFIGREAFDDR
jgi:hypothetical protein